MSERKFRKSGVATFQGLAVNANKTVVLKMKFRYDEILTSVELLQGLNTDITVHAKLADRKPVNLGMFTLGGISFDKDGNATIPFKSLVDNVNLDHMCELPEQEYIQLRFMAVLELPDNEEQEGDNETWED